MLEIEIARLWRSIARGEIGEIVKRNATLARFELDRYAQPGFVGLDYPKGGLLLIGLNPGSGSSYVQSTEDDRLAKFLAALREAQTDDLLLAAMRQGMRELAASVLPNWKITINVIAPLLRAVRLTLSQVAFVNLVKFRTADLNADRDEVGRSWEATSRQIALLDPRCVVCLGKKTRDKFARLYRGSTPYDVITRQIGDSALPAAGAADIARIAAHCMR